MTYEKKEKLVSGALSLTFVLAIVCHYVYGPWGFYSRVSRQEAAERMTVVTAAEGWLGTNEYDGSHQRIVDLYNSQESLPVGYVLQNTDSWCAAFVTAVAMQTLRTDIIPPECGCERQIELWKALGRWQEDDDHIPQPGDLIYYDWNVTEQGSCTGWADHVGIVAGVKWPFVKVIEGNKDDDVSYRVIPIGDMTIRGYGLPEYGG